MRLSKRVAKLSVVKNFCAERPTTSDSEFKVTFSTHRPYIGFSPNDVGKGLDKIIAAAVIAAIAKF